MRVIPIGCIRKGMVLGKDIYGKNGEILLRRGTTLNERYIQRLGELGYNAIYISDNISENIDSTDVISGELRNKTVQTVKKIYVEIGQNNVVNKKKQKANLNYLLNNIIDEMLANSSMVYNMIDLKVFDNYTFHHCVNVAIISIAVAMGLGYDKENIFQLGLGALMHDIGKVFIPIEIINKKGKLTNEEYKIIKTHSKKGYDYLKEAFYMPSKSYLSVLMHHERYDGNGYPEGLSGDAITVFGKIMSVSDVFDALTSKRPYRDAQLPSEAIEYIMGNYGKMFDPYVTKMFLKKVSPYPVGMIVKTSDGRKGIVAENHPDFPLRPKIRIFNDNGAEVKPYEIKLGGEMENLNITITGVEEM